jgi:hypothetical protein
MNTKFLKTLILLVTMLSGMLVSAQKFIPYSGDINILKNQKTLNVRFNYEKMKVGALSSEKEYIEKRVNEYEAKKSGKGAEWLSEWNDNKKSWEAGFVETLNKKLKKNGIVSGLNQNQANYTLYIYPLFLEIGWYALMVSQNAELDLEIFVCATNDLENQKARILIENAYGDKETDNGRISWAYKHAAEKFGKFLRKNIL